MKARLLQPESDMRFVSRRAVVAGLLAAPALPRAAFAQPGCAAETALANVADKLLAQMPELAVYNGLPSADALRRFDDYSPAGEARLRATLRSARDELRSSDCPASSEDSRHLAIGRAILDNALRSADIPYGHLRPLWFSGHEPYVVSQISGPHIDSANQMTAQQSVRSVAEAEAYVAKLRDFRRSLGGAATKMRADAAMGCVPPAVLMTKALAVMDGFVAPKPADHPLVAALVRKMDEAGLDQAQRSRLAEAAVEALRERVYPAYGGLREAAAELAAIGKAEDGLWAQPRGDELYVANAANLGDTSRTPDEIHKVGLDEVARITAEMDALLKREGYRTGTVGERMTALAGEARFLYPDSEAGREQLLADVRAMVKRAQAAQPRFLHKATIPPQPVEVRRVPVANQDSAPGGYYDGPSLDGSRPGIYWINLRDVKEVAKFSLPTLTYHEAVPGHHLQNAVQINQGDLPLLLKLASFNAYSEGWALYAERLAKELGFYADDPFGDLGRLQDELFRAVRLVVDTGIHAKRWSRQQAIDYMSRTTGNPISGVTAEIERYMAWPGQALGYKLGMIRLLELREQAKRAAGKRFDVRDFHDAVLLNGPAPLAIIEGAVRARPA
jgi:uncharacterized protein (DUF885 family)